MTKTKPCRENRPTVRACPPGGLALGILLALSACAPLGDAENATDDELEANEQALKPARLSMADIRALSAAESPAMTEAEARAALDARYADPGIKAYMGAAWPKFQSGWADNAWVMPGSPNGDGYSWFLFAARKRLGATLVGGEILRAHIDLGWGANGRSQFNCGFPVDDGSTTPGGWYSHFSECSIWYRDRTEKAYEVHGAIRDKFGERGWEEGCGFPITDQKPLSNGEGGFNEFDTGNYTTPEYVAAIFYHPSVGAHWVSNRAYPKYKETGGATGALGYPKADTTINPGGYGEVTTFEHGAIYRYYSGATGWRDAHYVKGAIYDVYRSLGETASELGFPTSDEQSLGNGRWVSDFQGGSIAWNVDRAAITYNNQTCRNGTCSPRPIGGGGGGGGGGGSGGGGGGSGGGGKPNPGGPKTCSGAAGNGATVYYYGLRDNLLCSQGVFGFYANSAAEALTCAQTDARARGWTVVEGYPSYYQFAQFSPLNLCTDISVPAFSEYDATYCAQQLCLNCAIYQGTCSEAY